MSTTSTATRLTPGRDHEGTGRAEPGADEPPGRTSRGAARFRRRRRFAGWPTSIALAWATCAAAPSAGAWELHDTLAGSTQGTAYGGQLGPSGWTTTGTEDSIVYVVPRLVSGSVEFTVTGITVGTIPAVDHEIFSMYDGGYGMSEPVAYSPYFRNNAFKMLVRIYGQNEPSRTGMQKLLYAFCPLGAPGYWSDPGCPCPPYNEEPFGGDTSWTGGPDTFRVEWTPSGASYSRNGGQVHSLDWSSTGILWGPEELHVMLGSPRNQLAPDVAMPVGVTYSNVHIIGTEGAATAACSQGTGGTGGTGGEGGGSANCSDALQAVSLTPSSGIGTSAAFDAVYRHSGGADQLTVAQLFVGESVSTAIPHINAAMDGTSITLDGQSCAIGEATTLTGTYGAVDCASSSYALDGTDATVHWAVDFDPDAMVGTHGVYMDAKAQGSPEPRLCWTQMGEWEVPGTAGSGGTGASGASGGAGGQGATAVGASPPGGGASGTDTGDDGCGCATPGRTRTSWAWMVSIAATMALRRARRRWPARR